MAVNKQLQSRIWFFSLVDEENDIPKIMENLKTCSAVQVFTILHDKDKVRQDDGTYVKKRNHHHFCVRFENPCYLSTIANIFELTPNDYHLIQKSKNWRSSCRYLQHLDQPDKYPYNISEVIVLKGTKDDYYNVTIGKANVVTTDADLFPDFGNFDKVPYKQQYRDIYDNVDDPKRRNNLIRDLKTCWENYLDKRKFEMENKNVQVIFVEGAPGSGKSTFAKQLAVSAKKSYIVSSSSNDVLQDYTCEDYLILDDLRDTTFAFEDLLKLLDNYVISSVKSRYKNKLFLGEYIVITSAKPLCEWYKDCQEDRNQLFRRITMFARCERKGNALIANIYFPKDDEPQIDENGNPNHGRGIIPNPIMDLTEKQVQAVDEAWKALGIDIEKLVGEVVQKAAQAIVDADEENN